MTGLDAAMALIATGGMSLAVGVLLGSHSRDVVRQRDQARADLARALEQVKLTSELHWVTAKELHDLDHYGPTYLEECDCTTCPGPNCSCPCHL